MTITAPPTQESTDATGDSVAATRTSRFRRLAEPRWYGFYALVVIVVLFSVLLPRTYPTASNVTAVFSNEAVGLMLAVGMLIPIVAGYFDLSLASVLTLSMIVSIGMFQFFEAPTWLACVAGVLTGSFIGLLNGISVAWLRINSMVATLAMGSIALGIALWWTNGSIFALNVPESFRALGSRVGGIPLPVVYAAVICVAIWWLLEKTPTGRYLYAMGDSNDAARLAGLPTHRLTVASFVASGTVAGIAGVAEAAILGSGNPQVGAGFLLPAFAAVFLGAAIYTIGRYNVIGTIVAVLVLAALVAGLQQFGLPFYIESLLKGVVLLAAVAFTSGRFSSLSRARK